jgi:transcriptional regulator with PAS, ATPase and Fis domain
MIYNVSEPVKEDIPSEEENTREYQESQEQRLLERQIRNAKREVELLGDLAEEKDVERVKRAQARMREFIKETGRTRRYDREQIVTQRNKVVQYRPKINK